MKKNEPEPMSEEESRQLARHLRDKYVDKQGYEKKIIVDDCVNQFIAHHKYKPGPSELKELDAFIRRRCIGKDGTYQNHAEVSSASFKTANRLATKSKGEKAAETGKPVGSLPTEKGKNKGQALELEPAEVTDKITSMPAPKLKRKKADPKKAAVAPSAQPTTQEVDEAALKNMLNPNPKANDGKGINKWGVLEVYKRQEFEKEKLAKIESKKQIMEDYKHVLDGQISQHEKVKRLDKLNDQTSVIKMQSHSTKQGGSKSRRNFPDEKTVKVEYDSLQKEMERSNIINPRGRLV